MEIEKKDQCLVPAPENVPLQLNHIKLEITLTYKSHYQNNISAKYHNQNLIFVATHI